VFNLFWAGILLDRSSFVKRAPDAVAMRNDRIRALGDGRALGQMSLKLWPS
jgi:hypothetical protein